MAAQRAPAPPGGIGSNGARPSPLRFEARLEQTSRWLWLVKWFLLIPHFIVLAFLSIAAFVLTVVAFFAILITGRYPRSIFDFNVGVLRWAWRVGFYGYSALGTDRYPPFSLAPVTEYPAGLEVRYPERLSRPLVLIKWWLLALPHYLILGLLVGGTAATSRSWYPYALNLPSGGVIGALVLVAALVLLVTGRYPRGLFDVTVGLDRWVYRVLVYVMLMSDEYPPFRLDMGEHEPGGAADAPMAAPPPPLPPPLAPAPPTSPWITNPGRP